MADTTFIDGDLSQSNRIVAAWLNDVNNLRYGAGSAARGSALLEFFASGTGAVARTTQSKLSDIVADSDYGSFAQAKTQGDSALLPVLATPTVNVTHEPPGGGGAVATNGYFKKGFLSGHLAIGNGPLGIDAMVGIRGDEYYTNVQQEVRGISHVVRNTRTTADEPTLGWDFFGLCGVVTVEAANTQYIRGNMKAVVGELYFNAPTAGSYTVLTSHNFQASAVAVGANVTLTNWYGMVVNSPTGAGTITTGYGLFIQAIDLPTTKAAIRLGGTGDGGRIFWTNTSITELSTGQMSIDLGTTTIKEDTSGKMEFNANSKQLVYTNMLTATTVGAAGAASMLPATPAFYERRLVGGIEYKVPHYLA